MKSLRRQRGAVWSNSKKREILTGYARQPVLRAQHRGDTYCAAPWGSLPHAEPRGSKGGDAMAGGNFDDHLPIGADGKISPAGPLGDFGNLPDATKIHFHFWVVQLQDGTAGGLLAGHRT